MPGQDFGGGDGLDRLAQAHFVADQRPARAYCKQGALGLIAIDGHLEQLLQQSIVDATAKDVVQRRGPSLGVALPRDKIERVVIGAQFMAGLGRRSHEAIQLAEAFRRQGPAARFVEQQRGRLR